MESDINKTIKERQEKTKQALIECLKEMPIITIATKKAGVSRDTYYRLRQADMRFKKASDGALREGVEFINDMSESQLITLIKEKKMPAISLWLKHNHQKYKTKAEIVIKESNEELTSEQKAVVKKALSLAKIYEEE